MLQKKVTGYLETVMALINIGGRMPDGVKVHEFWVDEADFVCASGTVMEVSGEKNKLRGKLCLLRDALIMLPYEGLWLKVGEFLISFLVSQDSKRSI